MKNLRLLSLVTVGAIACTSVGYAKDYYISGQVGAALAQGKLKSENLFEGSAKKSLSNAAIFDVIVGRNISSGLSAELEVAYAKHKFARSNSENHTIVYYDEESEVSTSSDKTEKYKVKSKVSSVSGFVNGKYKFENLSSSVIPYVSAGIGFSSNKTTKTSYEIDGEEAESYNAKNKTKNNFAWQVGVGALVPVNETVSFDFNCKYRDLGKVVSANYTTEANGTVHRMTALKGKLRTINLMAGVTVNF